VSATVDDSPSEDGAEGFIDVAGAVGVGPQVHPLRTSLRQQLVAGDVIALVVTWGAFTAAKWPDGAHLIVGSAAAVLATLVAMERAGLYRSRICALRSLEVVRVSLSCVVGALAYMALRAVGGRADVASALVAAGISAAGVLVLRWRFGRWLKARRASSKFLRTVVLVGANEDAEGLWTVLTDEPGLGYRVGALVGAPRAGAPWAGADLPWRPGTGQLAELARDAGANGIIVVASALSSYERTQAVSTALAAGLHVQIWPGFYGFSSRRTRLVPASGLPLLYVEPPGASPWQLAVKRAVDIGLALVLAVLTAPFMLAAVVAIKLDDAGPVIYRSERVGRGGSHIQVLKFRTMVPGAHLRMQDVVDLNERKGPLFKASNDPRVTRVGRALRATSIDELPQLWNVLAGTMSLVGPRPALPQEVAQFDPELRRRHQMRPGVTGLWQVEARDNPSFSAYRRLDLSYVDDWSLALDAAIVASTVHELSARMVREVSGVFSRGRGRSKVA
jgi:exopolysaccharide biosynthesis polyprenyl glycosylphosphotransferase